MISAKIIKDSRNPTGNRLTTFVLTFPRYILAEFNTHRMISRNSASSRAIPFKTMLEKVINNPFIPIKFMKEHKGMQGNEYFENEEDILKLTEIWLSARNDAVVKANKLNENDLTKQMCNRILEPFLYHTIIASGTEWENFFALRAHEAAEIHFQDLAFKMLDEYNNSEPILLNEGEWHIPFGDLFEEDRIEKLYVSKLSEVNTDFYTRKKEWIEKTKVEIATSRCARISYGTFEGKDDYQADIKLHDRLLESGHLSPFEHCAKSMDNNNQSGNFIGFEQYRKTFQNENRIDSRIKKITNNIPENN